MKAIAAASLLAFALASAFAAAAEPTPGRALLIGIQDYAKAPRLVGEERDVRVLEATLIERGGYPADRVRTIINSARGGDADFGEPRTESESLKAEIASWLTGCRADEAMLLYFSGHGFRDDQNRLYLAAVDCDPADPKPGGIPIAELRQMLVNCAARSKLLVLDACHAGSAGSARPEKAVQAKELNEFFEQTEGLVTLASCTGEETSQLWPAKKQSLFAYWLAQGLRGHADREPLGQITINELDDYVSQKVRWSARKLWSLEQTPTRLQGPGVSADTDFQLRPCDLKTLLDDLAEQMDVLIRLAGIEAVGIVPEFVSGQSGNRLGREYGLLATNCPVELANLLSVTSEGDYRVLSINAIRETLQEKGIAPRDVGTSRSRGLSVEGNSVGALVDGRVIGLQGEALALQCNLLGTEDESLLGVAGGTARLCGSELAMQGASGVVEPVVEPQATYRPDLMPAQIDAATPHPAGDSAFPYGVRVMVRGSDGKLAEREPIIQGNLGTVALQQDEVFELYVANRSGEPVFARVLVDGLNTLPEKSQAKGLVVEPAVVDEWRQAQPVNLVEARAWGPLEPGREYAIRGFFRRTGADAEYDEFKVVDAVQAMASEAGYTDQLGLITAAFYQPTAKGPLERGSRGFGIGRGMRYRTQTETYSGDEVPGRILGVVHIRYGP